MYIRRAGCGSGVALIHEMQHGGVEYVLVVGGFFGVWR